ncbi:F-type conjugal transfer pilus assembly protein TraB [Candidatus Regiella insecticola]|uniref:Conjugal transfer protein TraB n=1 Tax=Candidatus Regiella insecticola TaxID=138073 RepID=A0A6L2ZM29_9ENTR|nr:F-type conjugal transfer pilus assembly protein TraB [Candidatus Regiella insecticola]GFN45365.1 conjugal transfer protein TraB [Candidatus Regiella insecticola]
MANINAGVKRKQITLFIAVALGLSAVMGVGWYASRVSMKNEAQLPLIKEPAPNMTGVVNATFDDKVQQNAIIESQATTNEIRKEMAAVRQQMDSLSNHRERDQKRISDLEHENDLLQRQLTALGNAPPDEPLPSVGFNQQDVPSPSAFYPGMGSAPPGQITYAPVPTMQSPGTVETTRFSYAESVIKPRLPYIPSGSFAHSLVIEGADTNAAVTGSQNTAPMQFRLTGKVQLPNDREVDLTGCFVNAEAYGDVSSERAEVRTRSLSCHLGNDIIDQKIAGHVSFMGKNGIKGKVVMRNGKILGWAFSAGFVDGIGKGIEKAASPQVGLGAIATMGARDIAQSGMGGGASQAAKTLSDYYIKRAEQYHAVIPIGAGNEVTVVFQEGFQLETLEEARLKKANKIQQQSHDAFSTPNMITSLNELKVGDLIHPTGQ